MPDTPDRPIYTIRLRADGKRDIAGLRWLLKRVWRDYQLKCILLVRGAEADTGAVAFPTCCKLVRGLEPGLS